MHFCDSKPDASGLTVNGAADEIAEPVSNFGHDTLRLARTNAVRNGMNPFIFVIVIDETVGKTEYFRFGRAIRIREGYFIV